MTVLRRNGFTFPIPSGRIFSRLDTCFTVKSIELPLPFIAIVVILLYTGVVGMTIDEITDEMYDSTIGVPI